MRSLDLEKIPSCGALAATLALLVFAWMTWISGARSQTLERTAIAQNPSSFEPNGAQIPTDAAFVARGGDRIGSAMGKTRRLPDLALSTASEGMIQAKQLELAGAYSKLPLSFEANEGQANPSVKFLSRGRGYSVLLSPDEAVFTLRSSRPDPQVKVGRAAVERPGVLSARTTADGFRKVRSATGLQDKSAERETILRMRLAGANPAPKIAGADELPGKTNYFIGDDPKQRRENVPTYARVNYQQVYPGVDLVYHGTNGKLEYDFVVAAGADPRVIRLTFEGAEPLELNAQGELVVRTAAGELRQHKPVVYQEVAGARHAISGSYVLRGRSEAGFEVAQYDASQPLIIDPVLSYSTYLGGLDFDEALSIAVDAVGNAYVTGFTGSTNFPTTAGASRTNLQGGFADVFVTKLNPTGTALVYSTYLGGNGFDEGYSIAVDAVGNAYVTGYTDSTNFPTTAGAFQTTYGAGGFADAFVTKLNATGTALVYSTYLGGDDYDEGNGIAVDSAGNAYVTGDANSSNFPITQGAFQTHLGGGTCFGAPCFDAFVTKLNPTGTSLVYSTLLGGNGNEAGYFRGGIAVDSTGNAYVVGDTTSPNFPTTPGAFQMTYGGGTCGAPPNTFPCPDAFVSKLDATGAALIFSTYLGGSTSDQVTGVAIDAVGNSYITGITESADFPTTPGALQTALSGYEDAFVTKLTPIGTALIYSTLLGGNSLDEAWGIAVDAGGNAYVTGVTQSDNFPITPGALKTQNPRGDYDAFVTKLNFAGTGPLVYSTYLGGSTYEQLDPTFLFATTRSGIAVDAQGSAYVTGVTLSSDFPTTPGAFQASSGGGWSDAFVAKIDDPSGTGAPPAISLTATQTSVTVPKGGTAKFPLTVVQAGALTSTIVLSCSGLPAGWNCEFTPATVPAGSGPTQVMLTVQTSAAAAQNLPRAPTRGLGTPGAIWLGLLALLILSMLLLRRRDKALGARPAVAMGVAALLLLAAGCASNSSQSESGGSPQSQAFTASFQVHAISGSTTASMPFMITVR